MPYKLKKDYFSKPAGTICEVYLAGTDYRIRDKKEQMDFAIFNRQQKDEYLELLTPPSKGDKMK